MGKTEISILKIKSNNLKLLKWYSNPTPDAIPMDGIPKFWPFDFKHQLYMSIDRKWKIRQDYTKQFTVTIDSQSFGDN